MTRCKLSRLGLLFLFLTFLSSFLSWFTTPTPLGAQARPEEKLPVYVEVKKQAGDTTLKDEDLAVVRQAVVDRLGLPSAASEAEALAKVTVEAKREERKNRFGQADLTLNLRIKAVSAGGDDLHSAQLVLVQREVTKGAAEAFRRSLQDAAFVDGAAKLRKALEDLPVLVSLYFPDFRDEDVARWKTKLVFRLEGSAVEVVKPPEGLKPPPRFALKAKAGRARVVPAVGAILNEEFTWRGLMPAPESITSDRLDRLAVASVYHLKLQFRFPPQESRLGDKVEEFLQRIVGQANVLVLESPKPKDAVEFALAVSWMRRPFLLSEEVEGFLRRECPELAIDVERVDGGFVFKGEKAYRVVFYLPVWDSEVRLRLEEGLVKLLGPAKFQTVGDVEPQGFEEAFEALLKTPETWAKLRPGLESAVKAALAGKAPAPAIVPVAAAAPKQAVACVQTLRCEVRGGKSVKEFRSQVLTGLRTMTLGEGVRELEAASGSADDVACVVSWPRRADELVFRLRRHLERIAPELEPASKRSEDGFTFDLAPRRQFTLGFALPGQTLKDSSCLVRDFEANAQVASCNLDDSLARRTEVPVQELALDVEYRGPISELTSSAQAALEKCLEAQPGAGGAGAAKEIHVALSTRGRYLRFEVSRWHNLRVDVSVGAPLRSAVSAAVVAALGKREDVRELKPLEAPAGLAWSLESALPAGKLGLEVYGFLGTALNGKGTVEFSWDDAAGRVTLDVAPERAVEVAFRMPGPLLARKVEWVAAVRKLSGFGEPEELPAAGDDPSVLRLSLKRSIPEADFIARLNAGFRDFGGAEYVCVHTRAAEGFQFELRDRRQVEVEIKNLPPEVQAKLPEAIEKTLQEEPGVRDVQVKMDGGSLVANAVAEGGREAVLPKILDKVREFLGSKPLSLSVGDAKAVLEMEMTAGAATASVPDGEVLLRQNPKFRECMVTVEGGAIALLLDASDGPDGGRALCPEAAIAKNTSWPVKGFLSGSKPVHLSFYRYAGAEGYFWATVQYLPEGTEAFPVSGEEGGSVLAEAPVEGGADVALRSASLDAGGGAAAGNAFVFNAQGFAGIRDASGKITNLSSELSGL